MSLPSWSVKGYLNGEISDKHSWQSAKTVLIVSQVGVLGYEAVKFAIAYYGLKGTLTDLTYWICRAPATFLFVGGGAMTYWAYREATVADAVGEQDRYGWTMCHKILSNRLETGV